MVDGGGETGLAKLGGPHLLGGEVAALEELEDDGALEEGVVGEIDDATAAGPDLADELVLLDLAALHGSIIASVRVWMMKGRTDWQRRGKIFATEEDTFSLGEKETSSIALADRHHSHLSLFAADSATKRRQTEGPAETRRSY